MASTSGVPYAARNDIVARVNKSETGLWLDEILKRCSLVFTRTLKTRKGYQSLLSTLAEHPSLRLHTLWNEDGVERTWVTHTKRHEGQPFPSGWTEYNPKAVLERPVEPEVVVVPPEPARKSHKKLTGKLTRPEGNEATEELTERAIELVGGSKREPPEERSRIVRTARAPRNEVVESPFSGLKALLEKASTPSTPETDSNRHYVDASGPSVKTLAPQPEVSVSVSTPAIENKETIKMSDNTMVPNALTLRQQAEEMLKVAAQIERQEKLTERMREIEEVQIEIARATVNLHKHYDAMTEYMLLLDTSSERLRKLLAAK